MKGFPTIIHIAFGLMLSFVVYKGFSLGGYAAVTLLGVGWWLIGAWAWSLTSYWVWLVLTRRGVGRATRGVVVGLLLVSPALEHLHRNAKDFLSSEDCTDAEVSTQAAAVAGVAFPAGSQIVRCGRPFHRVPVVGESAKPITIDNGMRIRRLALARFDPDATELRLTLAETFSENGWACRGELTANLRFEVIECELAEARAYVGGKVRPGAFLSFSRAGDVSIYQDGEMFMLDRNLRRTEHGRGIPCESC